MTFGTAILVLYVDAPTLFLDTRRVYSVCDIRTECVSLAQVRTRRTHSFWRTGNQGVAL